MKLIVFGGCIFSSLGSIYYQLIIWKNKKILLKDLKDYEKKNPYEIISDEEAEKFKRKYIQMVHKPLKTQIVLSIIAMIFGVSNIILH